MVAPLVGLGRRVSVGAHQADTLVEKLEKRTMLRRVVEGVWPRVDVDLGGRNTAWRRPLRSRWGGTIQ